MYSETALKHISELQSAPSVALQDVPRESLGSHLGFEPDDEIDTDELDEQLARKLSDMHACVVVHI